MIHFGGRGTSSDVQNASFHLLGPFYVCFTKKSDASHQMQVILNKYETNNKRPREQEGTPQPGQGKDCPRIKWTAGLPREKGSPPSKAGVALGGIDSECLECKQFAVFLETFKFGAFLLAGGLLCP